MAPLAVRPSERVRSLKVVQRRERFPVGGRRASVGPHVVQRFVPPCVDTDVATLSAPSTVVTVHASAHVVVARTLQIAVAVASVSKHVVVAIIADNVTLAASVQATAATRRCCCTVSESSC
jgi:hypothetical protein